MFKTRTINVSKTVEKWSTTHRLFFEVSLAWFIKGVTK